MESKQKTKKRSALSWPFHFGIVTKVKTKRTTRVTLKLSNRQSLVIVLRKFRIQPLQRSTRTKQIVLSWPWGTVRQVVLSSLLSKSPTKKHRFQVKKFIPATAIIAGVLGIVIFSGQLTQQPPVVAEVQTLPAPAATAERVAQIDKTTPHALNIPSLDITVGIKPMGLLADGSLETPPSHEYITGWYKYGSLPGDVGPAVIVGHVDNLTGPAVFYRLRQLKSGEIVSVLRGTKTYQYRVSEVMSFDRSYFPTERVYGQTDRPTLRLITCGGTFNRRTGQYSHNTVVFAEIINS